MCREIGLLLLCLPAAVATPGQTAWQAIGQIGGPTQALAVRGHYAYLGVGLRLARRRSPGRAASSKGASPPTRRAFSCSARAVRWPAPT